jgi:hypothetical protein
MRAYQVFGRMSDAEAARFLAVLAEKAPAFHMQALGAAAAALRARPQYVMRQPHEKRAQAVRRALARVAASPVAEELLAVYFLDCRKELLIEWLDALGLEHEEGVLKADQPAEPEPDRLRAAVAAFRQAAGVDGEPGDRAERELLLRSFAAQSAIDWPALEGLVETS